MNVCSLWSACNYSRIEIRFVFYAICPTSCNLQRVIAAGNLQLAPLIGQFVRSLIFHAIIFWCYMFFVVVFVPLQNDESHSVVLPAFIDTAQCHKARLYGTAGCGTRRRSSSSWSRGRWSGWRSSRCWCWCGLCQRISSGLPRCTGHTGAYFIHCQNASFPSHASSTPFAVWQQMSHIFVTVFRARIFIGHFRFL